ncbi:PTS system, maltose and glucose-specific IIC component / PTS system, maltose and glucose-specific IIB component / PTS system, maltose and glucose-specific IIA component [Streptococcus criceti]|uniref:PTS system glucose-specific EIICBA component n=1 Tax=Streptococcus criceti HS-6 TaxID=873449 RepID=G5JN86_STRCG|nr:PTS transporter subunit IIBC [Streptococcus criceti]EHI75160.1 putative PTS system glucose-specific EIICBA component [Streptococcus criceti HS-6]SUN41636.1 PTS system, maltose and glucose-specific IIC component / PTS system, maltose and glucose-specific IIB component / PTS system, maltose and glucose-specific IIA component [Streptococcus criceti]
MKNLKSLASFEFWQKFGKCLMVVIAVMPAAGLMISIGNSLALIAPDNTTWTQVTNLISQIGWGFLNNLHLLFALAIGGSWAKEKAGGAFAAGISFILINLITGNFYGVTTDMLADDKAVVHNIFGGTMRVADYFINVLNQPALNMGVFVGIIAGFVGATAYNKYYNFRKLPDVLTFFNGKRFVPFVVILRSAIVGIIMAIFWPLIQTAINNFGQWLANSQDTAPFLAPFLYGTLERLLLPFGLHHMLTIPMNYTQLGGTYHSITTGKDVLGQDPLWLAWVTDLIHLKGSHPGQYQHLLTHVTPARFKVGQMIGASGILMGMTVAMYRNVDPDKKKKYKSMFISAAAATFLTGVTEPLEYMFMFAAMPLYLVYAFIQGCAFAMADLVHLRLHSFGNIELLTRTPMAIKAGLGVDVINFIWVSVLFGLITYFIGNFMIQKMNLATAGRNGNYDSEEVDEAIHANNGDANTSVDSQIVQIINLLGGQDNIDDVDACMTRLRVTVKDPEQVGGENDWKKAGALGLVVKGHGVQAVYGPKADGLKSDIQDLLDSGARIPIVDFSKKEDVVAPENTFKGVTENVLSVAEGEIISIDQVKDPVFSGRMMGDGFAVQPTDGHIYSPVAGVVTSVFPTKHAYGLLTDEGLEVLVHIGIDTVSLNGIPFSPKVTDGQRVEAGDLLAVVDLDALEAAGKEKSVIVVFTNAAEVKSVTLENLGKQPAKALAAKVEI